MRVFTVYLKNLFVGNQHQYRRMFHLLLFLPKYSSEGSKLKKRMG